MPAPRLKNRRAEAVLRRSDSINSRVYPSQSTARYLKVHLPRTFMYVSSICQETAAGFFLAGALAAIRGKNFTTQRFNVV